MANVIEQNYRALVKCLFDVMSPQGFKKKGEKFFRDHEKTRVVIELQKSRRSTSDRYILTANISVVCKDLLDPEFDEISNIGGYGGHVRWRMGDFLPLPQDKWWELREGGNIEKLCHEISSLLTSRVFPTLDIYSNPKEIVTMWESGVSPGISDKQRKDYLAVLKKIQ